MLWWNFCGDKHWKCNYVSKLLWFTCVQNTSQTNRIAISMETGLWGFSKDFVHLHLFILENQWHTMFSSKSQISIDWPSCMHITDTTKLQRIAIYFSICVCIGYLSVQVNHSKLNSSDFNKILHQIFICNKFAFNITQYSFVVFYFHALSPACCKISTQHPDRKQGSFKNLSRFHSSHIAVNLQYYQIKTTENESKASN